LMRGHENEVVPQTMTPTSTHPTLGWKEVGREERKNRKTRRTSPTKCKKKMVDSGVNESLFKKRGDQEKCEERPNRRVLVKQPPCT